MASWDRWECQYLKAEMYFYEGNPQEALDCLEDIMEYCNTEDDSMHFVSMRIKSMLLKAQIRELYASTNLMNYSGLVLINDAFELAKKYHLHYWAAMAEMHTANLQLNIGCAKNALFTVRKVLPKILAHGGCYDIARGTH